MSERSGVAVLKGTLEGQIIVPGDGGYDECRQVFNAMHDKRPAVIARCASASDVVAAVNFAREHALEVAVRSGGHSVAGLSVCEGGILIDLAGLKSIEVDPEARTARAGGGVSGASSTPRPNSTRCIHRAAASPQRASAASRPAAATVGRPQNMA